ncbi:hypothetical protein [Aporhodopirellula aestuarii]|uniref:Uncharacterized protein n=1 Tax=Aporhodopirellula aestuarii TaxID=2950107 RepID=A0ABT0TYQ9_9BACT|nr:hypothetical protein [Aporhodopirellula aestuarii]MCM2369732.1 hypothetical protein [Aporhodopirellula aestuarii]
MGKLMSESENHYDAPEPRKRDEPIGSSKLRLRIRVIVVALVAVLMLNLIAASSVKMATDPIETHKFSKPNAQSLSYRFGRLTAWWTPISDHPPSTITAINTSVEKSNIHPDDYSGPESCSECHAQNYASWATHSHRFMNAYANESTVKGDFSGNSTINYFDGLGEFYREDDEFRMRLTRDSIKRVYTINQTIGSRFTQYYVGKMIQGPEPADHDFYKTDHVLPFGYWMDERQWVPIVHVHQIGDDDALTQKDEDQWPSDRRLDPFSKPGFVPYSVCNDCHTTFPLADLFVKSPDVLGMHFPHKAHFSVSDYLTAEHPAVLGTERRPSDIPQKELMDMIEVTRKWEAPDKAVNLGISCEACHMGNKAHVMDKRNKPDFFVKSPHLRLEGLEEKDFGRTHLNVNYMCGRCHAGSRPIYAGGMATWNSTEYTDATRGSCYSELKCIDCHDPHTGIGKKWKPTPTQDDQSCIRCHEQFTDPDAVQAHTHHKLDSGGSRCMNCHMPRINEGMQDVVRTHTIFSPTNSAMIEKNHPNACNMCHTEQPIDWTLTHLEEWYGKTFSAEKLSKSYPDRDSPVAKGWLASRKSSVRLIGADTLFRTKSLWAIDELVDALDDPFLINRQFVGRGLEQMLNINLEDVGYQFYMTADERREALEKLRDEIQAQKLMEETPVAPAETDAGSE